MRLVRPNTRNRHLAKLRSASFWRSVPGIIWSNWLSSAKNAMRRIAVIDNDPSSCQLIADALRDSGTQIVCATTGRLGRRLLTSVPFYLALIEIVLPDASGIALAGIAANRNTPVLFMTGRASATNRLKDCPCPCLLKPIDLVRLHAKTKKVMAESLQNVQRVKESRARYFASLTGFADAMAGPEGRWT
jgi:DNA-binding response OmpR family regulator